MSKKKKNKKKFKAQLHQELQKIQQQQSAPVTEELKNGKTYEPADKAPEKITEQKSEFRTPKVDKEKKTEETLDEYSYVKKDITKIVMIMSICIVLLVTIWILSLRTNYVSNFANQLATFFHLSQGK